MDKILKRSYLVVDVLENQVKKKVDCCPTRGMGRKIKFNKEFSLLVLPALRRIFFVGPVARFLWVGLRQAKAER